MIGKFHYFDYEQNQKLPKDIRNRHNTIMEYAAIDGYIRPRCTSIIPLVDCFYCREEMRKRGIIKQ